MVHRMKLTDIKTARTHRESFPFLRANIQRLVGGGGKLERECLSLKLGTKFLKLHKKRNFFKP